MPGWASGCGPYSSTGIPDRLCQALCVDEPLRQLCAEVRSGTAAQSPGDGDHGGDSEWVSGQRPELTGVFPAAVLSLETAHQQSLQGAIWDGAAI